MKRLYALVFICIALAGCEASQPADPKAQTYAARTALAASIDQTIAAQQTQRAYVAAAPTAPPPVILHTFVATLTQTPTFIIPSATAPPERTPSHTPAAVAAAPLTDGVTLPLRSGLTLTIDRAEVIAEAGWYEPKHGQYLTLFGVIENRAAGRQCIYSRQIRLGFEGNRYAPYVEAMSAMRATYQRNYPGPFNGQCVDANSQTSTFMMFDAPKHMKDFAFLFENIRAGGLRLVARGDGAFDVETNH